MPRGDKWKEKYQWKPGRRRVGCQRCPRVGSVTDIRMRERWDGAEEVLCRYCMAKHGFQPIAQRWMPSMPL